MPFLAQEGGTITAVFRSFEKNSLWVVLAISLLALGFAAYLRREVLAAPEGTEKMKSIARAIQEGSRAYLSRQFRTVAMFMVLITIGLYFVLPVPKDTDHAASVIRLGRSIAFILGAS